MTFPSNNLPSSSKYWVREVEKKIVNLENSLSSSDINNTTRDSQLQVTASQALIAAQAADDAATEASVAAAAAADAAQDALDAIDAANAASALANDAQDDALAALQDIVDLGSPGGPSINASNISAGTISADFISGGTIDASDINGVTISGGTIDGSYITGVIIETGGEVSAAEVNCGILYANQTVQANGGYLGTVNTTIANNTTSSFGGNVFINTSGNMFRSTTTSSREAKENIQAYSFDTDAFISVNPVTFNYKKQAVLNEEEADINQLGFILEDFEEAGVAEHLVIPANEMDKYKGLRYDKLYMMLHKVVQQQDKTIKDLTARIEALEAE